MMSSLLGMIGGMIVGLFGPRQNPLNHAVRTGNLAKTMDLVQKGHSINGPDVFDTPLVFMDTPLQIAINNGDKKIFNFFLNNCEMDYSESLRLASEIGQKAIEDLIVAKVISPDHNRDGYTRFHLAAQTGNEEMMRELLSRGADGINQATSYGYAPLHLAVRYGHHAMAKLLLEHGADANKLMAFNGLEASELWMTPIHTLIEYRRNDAPMLELLLDHGAAVSDGFVRYAEMYRVSAPICAAMNSEAETRARWTLIRSAWVGAVVRAPQVFYAGGGSAGASDSRLREPSPTQVQPF